jgi:hypothetical protein
MLWQKNIADLLASLVICLAIALQWVEIITLLIQDRIRLEIVNIHIGVVSNVVI